MQKKYLLITFLSLALVSCNNATKYDVTTTMFPQYDIVKQIAKDKLSVTMTTPFGAEVHGYSPTAKDIVTIKDSSLFLYTSELMDNYVSSSVTSGVNAVNLQKSIKDIPYENTSKYVDNTHYWTDPLNFIQMIEVVTDEIIKIDAQNEDFYMQNADSYMGKIEQTHLKLVQLFSDNQNTTIFFAGHNAMTPFSSRYNFNIKSLIDSYKPDADLTYSQLSSLIESIKTAKAHTIFVEELAGLKLVNAIKREIGSDYELNILELHGYHNITKKQDKDGITYASLLEQNYENIKKALTN